MSANAVDDAGREERLNEVLLAYVEAAEAGRPADRRRLLAENPDLRAELEEFFAGHDAVERLAAPLRGPAPGGPTPAGSSGGAAPPPAAGAWPAPADGDAPGLGTLGDFRLLREVGRGGMGVVYEAEQISLRRRVALKVLPFAAAIDPRQLQRFRNEALAAAHLRHEHIVPVFAVGADRGVHYYAMQFVDGQSLADLIAALRNPAEPRLTPPAPAPAAEATGPYVGPADETHPARSAAAAATTSRERSSGRGHHRRVAGIGREAALALEHAHQAGIVHRDVKPANLLLDARGNVWVTDFGLAQFGADAGLTLTGELLGTLRYASPEQALAKRGLVDHRSDVYSLGATLYELLTLKPLFDGRDRHELLRQIADADPVPPRAADRSVPVELETVVLKALAKEPRDRYATAQDLADDLQRFLEDRPILARRPSLAEKARKWARRHRTVVGSAAATLLLTVVAVTGLTAQAYERERTKAAEAEKSFRQAQEAVDQFARIAEEELAGRPEYEPVRRRMLEAALVYYQNFLEQRRDDPSTQQELEASRAKAERILGELATLMGAFRYLPLHARDVQEDLLLSKDQRESLARIHERMREAFRGSFGCSPSESEQRRVEMARQQEAEVKSALNPEQLDRLKQIRYQVSGAQPFSEPEVVEALQLTAKQQERVRELQAQGWGHGPGFRPPPGGPGKPPGGPDRHRPEGGRRDEGPRNRADTARDAVLKELSPAQLARWQDLIGRKFDGNPDPFAPRPEPSGR